MVGAALAALGVYGRFYFDDFSIDLPSGYASAFAIPIEVGAGIALIGLANLFAKSALLKDLGKKCFAIDEFHDNEHIIKLLKVLKLDN